MFRYLIALLILCSSFLTSNVKAEPVELATLNEITTIMAKHYYDTSYNGLDWDKMVTETKENILNSSSSEERYGHITKLLKSLKHSHLEFMPPGISKEEGPKIPVGTSKEINFDLELVNDKWTVTRLLKGSDADKAGLKLGMVVTQLNKWKINDLFKKDKITAYYRLNQALQTFPKKTIKVYIENLEKPISWMLSSYDGYYEKLGHITSNVEFEKKILPGNIGYFRFSLFLISPAKKAIQAIKEFRNKDCPGIIIDLRNNPGGVAMMAPAIAKEFCFENYNLGTQKGRDMTMTFPVFKQPNPYPGTVVILVNKNSASTSEIMAAGIKAKGYAYVIGETTAGMALPSVMISLNDGSIFQYPVADFKTIDGKNIEGIGAKPNLEVSHTKESLIEGKDIFIEEAVKYINSQKKE